MISTSTSSSSSVTFNQTSAGSLWKDSRIFCFLMARFVGDAFPKKAAESSIGSNALKSTGTMASKSEHSTRESVRRIPGDGREDGWEDDVQIFLKSRQRWAAGAVPVEKVVEGF